MSLVEVDVRVKDQTGPGVAAAVAKMNSLRAAAAGMNADVSKSSGGMKDMGAVSLDMASSLERSSARMREADSAAVSLGSHVRSAVVPAMEDAARSTDTVARSADSAAKSSSQLSGVSGMGSLIAAGVALAPIIATVGTGILGLGAAAYGVVKPIQTAAQATGGLSANMAKLSPEQQQVARGLLSLGQVYDGFQKNLQGPLFAIFNQGLGLSAHLLGDVEPVARATGNALASVIGQIDREFASGTWQQFFGFMAHTAGPDVHQLGTLFTDLLNALPPLLQALQPVGQTLVTIATQAARAAGPIATLLQTASENAAGSAHNFNQGAKAADNWVVAWTNRWIPGAKTINRWLGDVQHAAGDTATGLAHSGDSAAVAGPKFFSLNQSVAALNTSMTKLVGNLLTVQGGELSWKQALQAAETQLQSNTAGLEGNSKNALANRQALLQATNAAVTYAQAELVTGKDISGASDTIQRQISWLQGLHDKSQFVRAELAALRREEALLQAQKLDQIIHVEGLGQWQVSQSLAPGAGHRRAAGGLISGGVHGRDSVPILAMPGEVVVPVHMVRSGAVDHLRGSLPGFGGGGVVPGYSGSPGGLTPWVKGNDQATIHLIDQAVVKATVAGMRAAQSAAASSVAGGVAGPGGGAPAANAALARSMMPSWGSGAEWSAWNYVAMRESGWNQFARNPGSGAYGIPQALPPGKMGAAANPPQSNPRAQLSWMIGYIGGRYGDPIGAAAHERAFNWYGSGLSGGVFRKPTLIGVGDKPERVDIMPLGQSRSVVLEVAPGGNTAFEQFMVSAIKKWVRVQGGGDVQNAFGAQQ